MDLQQVLRNLDLETLSSCEVVNETVIAALSSLAAQHLQSTTTSHLQSDATPTASSWLRDIDHASNYTLPTGIQPTSPEQVAWPTAFWALALMAVNTCLQDCGRVCEYSKFLAPLVRSSPVYCLLDSLIIIIQLGYYSILQGPRRAVQVVSLCRDQRAIRLDEVRARPVHHIMRGLLLTLTILQTVKLFALQGLLCSQIFGACYLLSYSMNGIINIFGKEPSNLSEASPPLLARGDMWPSMSFIRIISVLGYLLQVAIWMVALKPAVPHRLMSGPESPVDFCLWPFHFMTMVCWFPLVFFGWWLPFAIAPWTVDIVILAIPTLLLLLLLSRRPFQDQPTLAEMLGTLFATDEYTIAHVCNVVSLLLFVTLRLCVLNFWVFKYSLDGRGVEVVASWIMQVAWYKMDPYLIVLTSILLAGLPSYAVARMCFFGPLAKQLRLEGSKLASNAGWLCLYLFCANLVLAVLYYSKVYDPQHTHKPKWIENLPRGLQ